LLSESVTQLRQLQLGEIEQVKIGGVLTLRCNTKDIIEEGEQGNHLAALNYQCVTIMLQGVNKFPTVLRIGMDMKETSEASPSLSQRRHNSCCTMVHSKEAKHMLLSLSCLHKSSSCARSYCLSQVDSSRWTTSLAISSCIQMLPTK
jgi:hypothetical protein